MGIEVIKVEMILGEIMQSVKSYNVLNNRQCYWCVNGSMFTLMIFDDNILMLNAPVLFLYYFCE